MKNNIKALELIEAGLSSKTVSKLTESQIDKLHSKMVSEVVTTNVTKTIYSPSEAKGKSFQGVTTVGSDGSVTVTKEGEIGEDDSDSAFEDDAMKIYTGQDSPHDESNIAPDGMDDDSGDDRKMVGMSESRKKKKNKPNPWAICHSQVGPKKTRKFERCVQAVKKSLKEGKNPVSLFLENEIMRIVEKHIPPRITKGDLLNYLNETETAPAKPKTDPKTKPGRPAPKPRPGHPGKNPNPGENPAPKAVTPERAKEEVINTIMKLLKK